MAIASFAASDIDSIRQEQARLRRRLAAYRSRLRAQMLLETAVDLVASVVAAGGLLLLADWWFRLGRPSRIVLLIAALSGVLWWVGRRAVQRWRASRLDDLSLAMTLDRFRPGIGEQIVNILQLPALLDDPCSASPALVRSAVRQASTLLAQSDWTQLWNRSRTRLGLGALAAALLVPVVFGAVAPRAARLGFDRWLRGSNERWPQRTYLSVRGLDDRNRLLVPRDEPFSLEITANPELVENGGRWLVPGRGEPFLIRTKPNTLLTPARIQIRERNSDGSVREAQLLAASASGGLFQHEIPPASENSTLELMGGDDWLGPLTVERVDRPQLREVRVRSRGRGQDAFHDSPSTQHPVFLPDTEVELTLVGTEPIAEARVTVQPASAPPFERVDDNTFQGRWVLDQAVTMEIELVSSVTGLSSKPTYFSIGLIKDRPPRVTMRTLGVGQHVTPVATIPLAVSATDDLGLAALRIATERSTMKEAEGDRDAEPETSRQTLNLALPADTSRAVLDHQARHDFELQTDPPPIGTILRFVAEAEDACARGSQVGRSGPVQLQVVSADELFYEILIRQRGERTRFLSAIDALEKQTPVLASEFGPAEATALLRGVQTHGRQLEQIGRVITDSLQEMKLNQIGSPKSHRLLQDGVIDPLAALSAGPVAQLRNVLQGLASPGRASSGEAETARQLHAEVLQKMKVILEQMSQWESFVDVVNQVGEVIKIEKNVLDATEKARQSQTEEVFDEK